MDVSSQRSVDRGSIGQVIELRNQPFGVPTALVSREGNTGNGAIQSVVVRPHGVEDPVHVCKLYVREPGELNGSRWRMFRRDGRGSPVDIIPT